MKSKFARLLDSLAAAVAIWLFSALVLRYFLPQLYTVVVAATVVTLAAGFLLRLKSSKTEEERYFGQRVADYFLLKDDDYILQYFFDALKKQYKQATISQGFIRINNTLVFAAMSEPLSLKAVVAFYTLSLKQQASTVVILCPSAQKNVAIAKERLTDLRLEIFDCQKTFRLLKSLGSVPQWTATPYKKRVKDFFSHALKPQRSKAYLFTSITLLIGAFFSQFWLYFLISGSLCLSLALLSRLNVLGKQ